jgi:deoxyribodipyrimidine photo-lyase
MLLLEPSFFNEFPVSDRTLEFVLRLSENIPGMQVFVGEWKELANLAGRSELVFKEHPAFRHFTGKQEERDWLFPNVSGYSPSFFSYWKKCERELKKMAIA